MPVETKIAKLCLVSLFVVSLCASVMQGCKPGFGASDSKQFAPPDTDLCAAACENLKRLGCQEGEPLVSPQGVVVSCEQFCIETQNTGIPLETRCVSSIDSCEHARACGASSGGCCL